MLGQNYFANRLGDVYKYSRIQYQSGKGISNKNIKYCWELCIDHAGNIIFVLCPDKISNSLTNITKTNIQFFSGTSRDGKWELECIALKCLAYELEITKKSTFFYLPQSVTLKRKTKVTQNPNLAKAYFSNFNFVTFDCNQGFLVNLRKPPLQSSLSCIPFILFQYKSLQNKKLCFQMLSESKQLIELIEIGRINHSILSQVIIPINKYENIQFIEKQAESISWFVSLINLNSNSIPIIEYLSGDDIIQYSIKNTVKNSFKKNYIIDNLHIDGGIPKAFHDCYENYQIWQSKIDINKFIDYLVEINQQDYIDLKWSTMILAYEYFLTKYLIEQNSLSQDETDTNIQGKLRLFNKHLRFIPRNMIKDKLRKSVRNPLFHQGEIVCMNTEDKISFFNDYYDLLIKIVLRTLGYTGKYMSVKNNCPESP